MSLTNTHETNLLNLIFDNVDWANIGDSSGLQNSATDGSLYVSLHTSDPGETGSDTNELSGYSYARQAVSRTNGWSISSNTADNAAAITFPAATGSWGTVTHFGIHYASTGTGNMVFYGALTSSKTIGNTDVLEIATGDLDITIT